MPRTLLGFMLVFALLGFLESSSILEGRGAPKKSSAKQKKNAKGDKDADGWSVDDVILAEQASEMRIAPDGQKVAWVKSAPDKEKNEMVSHLMLSSLTEKKDIQLTRGGYGSSSPRWSPDGKLLAFLSSRPAPKGKRDAEDDKDDAKTQIWLIDPQGGEPWPLTKSGRDVRQFAWADADTILYVAQEKIGYRETELKEKKDDTQVVDDEKNEPPVRLWRTAVKEKDKDKDKDKDKKSQRITLNRDRMQSLSLAPDGKHAVTIHERSMSYDYDQKIKPEVFLYDVSKNEFKQIFAGKQFNIANIYWEEDSKGFYAVNSFTTDPHYLQAYVSELYHYDLAEGAPARVNLDWPRGLGDPGDGFAVTKNGFLALLADGVRHKPMLYVRKGKQWEAKKWDNPAKQNVQAVRLGRDGKTLVYQESSAVDPPRWHRARLENGAVKDAAVLTDLQADVRKLPRAKTEVMRWKGALGEEVEGLVSYPHDYEAGKKYPLVVTIHGGPFWADFDFWDERWSYVRNPLCERGAFVLRPNYHGSSNYGLAWAESIAYGKYYTLPVEDIEKGIDAFVARGQVEPDQIALGGWSNGAILTMALITRRNYRAASAGAGGSEWVSDWGVCDFGMCFSNYYLGKSPYEDPSLYRKNAPFFDFPKVRTPTILFHGTDDRDVPTLHGWLQFRALQQLGKTDVRFLLFPGEKHGLKKLSHRRRKVEEELAWFDKHLFKSAKPVNLALKDESPLAQKLALGKAAKQGRLYGVSEKDVLVPETVEYEEVRIGRFEVTRAQFAQFDKKYVIAPGTENYPANGVSFEQAQAYCAWLKKATGRPYRLGRLKEMQNIYEDVDVPENTLDFWAGYATNPEDRRRLEASIMKLGGSAPLLKEVGSFRSADPTTAIFDLGGNVAEWVDDGGKGKALGGSADLPADERAERTPAPEYIGFRVFVEEPPS